MMSIDILDMPKITSTQCSMTTIPDSVSAMYSKWLGGATLKAIAASYGYSHATGPKAAFNKYGLRLPVSRHVCPTCGRPFLADRTKIFCRRKCAKTGSYKRIKGGRHIARLPCALPECSNLVRVVWFGAGKPSVMGTAGGTGNSQRYCCRSHADRHIRRVNEGLYARLLGADHRKCCVCGEPLILDEHHVEWDSKTRKSNKSSTTVWLCPTHHAAVHRGLLEVSCDGTVTNITTCIMAGLEQKKAIYDYTLVKKL